MVEIDGRRHGGFSLMGINWGASTAETQPKQPNEVRHKSIEERTENVLAGLGNGETTLEDFNNLFTQLPDSQTEG